MAGQLIVPVVTKFDDRGLKQAQKAFGKIGASLKAAVGAVTFGAIVSGLNSAGKAAAEDAKSQALLATQLRTTLGATNDQVAATEEQIKSMSILAGVADDQIRPAFAQLVRVTGDLEQAATLTSTALDIAAAKGVSVESAATALGKAAQGSTGGLAKLGINLKGVAKPLEFVQSLFAGAAKAAADASPYERLNVLLGELQESLGVAIIPLVNVLSDAIKQLQPVLESTFSALQPVFDAIKPLIERLTPILNRVIGTVGRLLSSLLPPIMRVLDAVLVALTPFIDLVLDLVDTILPPLTTILNDYLVPAFEALANAMANPNSYISQLSTALGDTLFMALQLIVEWLGYMKTSFDMVMEVLAPVIQGFEDWADSLGIDFGVLIANLNPLMMALNSLQLGLATTIWSMKLLNAAMKLDFDSFGKILAGGPLAVLNEMKNKAKGLVDETDRLLARQANQNVKPLVTGALPPGAGGKDPSKTAADAAKKYADAYAKILEMEAKIREEATQAAQETRDAIQSMRDSFNSLLDGVKPLKRATVEIGEFEQQTVDSFSAIEEAIGSALADGTLLQDAADNLRAYAASEKNTLAGIARQRDALTKKIDIAKAISAGVLSVGNLTGLLETQSRTVTESFTQMVNGIKVVVSKSFEEITQGGLVDNFKKVIDKTKAYAKNLIELKRLGLNGQLFKQLVDAGVDGGSEAAQAIADGGQATVTELNGLFGELNNLGSQIAETSTDIMFAAGEDTMNSFIAGLLAQDAALEATAVSLADKFASTFRNRLTGLTPMPAMPMNTSDISLSDALTGYVSDQLGRTFTGPYNYMSGQMVGGLGSNYNININAGVVTNKQELGNVLASTLKQYVRVNGPIGIS